MTRSSKNSHKVAVGDKGCFTDSITGKVVYGVVTKVIETDNFLFVGINNTTLIRI